jgi:hypothetical protein
MTALDRLCRVTGTGPSEGEDADGPDSGVGVDYYFAHPSLGIWYVSEDQRTFTVECCGD